MLMSKIVNSFTKLSDHRERFFRPVGQHGFERRPCRPAMFNSKLLRRIVPLIAVAAILSSTPALNAQVLSREGRQQKAIHDYLFGTFVEGRETKYVGTGRDRGLKEVTILAETEEIQHGDEVLLPEGAERVAGLFRHFAFHGDHLDAQQQQFQQGIVKVADNVFTAVGFHGANTSMIVGTDGVIIVDTLMGPQA